MKTQPPPCPKALPQPLAKKGGSLAEWQAVARRALAGEYDAADGSEREALEIGLRSWGDETCGRALARIKDPAGHKVADRKAGPRHEGPAVKHALKKKEAELF